MSWFQRLPLLLALVGCATRRDVTTLPEGLTVYTFRRDYTNAHLVARGDAFFLVDAGLEENAPALAEDLRRSGFDPAGLRAIVLTHGHADHAGGAAWFQRSFGTPIVAGAGDSPLLRAGANDALCPTSASARGRLASDQAARFTPLAPDRALEAEASLEELVGLPGAVVPLAGHTPGSLVVTVPGAALVGDLFRGAIVGATAETHFYQCDLADNRADVRELLERLAPTAEVFFPGHFGPVGRPAVLRQFPSPPSP
jgi:glyoxylase-like metal-dependent hydrolase (beta-lactamase superfamily II)